MTRLKPTLPDNSLLYKQSATIHYQDTFATTIAATPPVTITQTGIAFATTAPRFVSRMMKLRDQIVGIFGLKTSQNLPGNRPSSLNCGDQLGIFKILEKNDQEVILGENDKHLDFRVSLYLQQQPTQQQLICTTVVHYHNLWGRIYFFFVKPFHKLLVPTMLKHTVAHLPVSGS
ncbi:MAG: DUF2867 domain-containing protein [Chitinophaga sp.]|uniref:DUF2867 domain-containing protein n=1 Tax=Chitinophaga sp. TaxID=1869181 RepID=UPI001B10DA22|nr:DUF2867 domain-containing protein [Chitinophaga sp.]MBO9727069.1 DUF2867 domain-containing protein [Chitinophaga sp.]